MDRKYKLLVETISPKLHGVTDDRFVSSFVCRAYTAQLAANIFFRLIRKIYNECNGKSTDELDFLFTFMELKTGKKKTFRATRKPIPPRQIHGFGIATMEVSVKCQK